MVEIARNESAKALQLAQDEASMEQFREQAATSRANVEALKVRKKSLQDEISTMEAQHTALKNSLELTADDLAGAQRNLESINKQHKEISAKYLTFNELAAANTKLENRADTLEKEMASTLGEMQYYKSLLNENKINLNKKIPEALRSGLVLSQHDKSKSD